ncbi:trypsin-like peptidase domain-containing protein [Streptomyces sp. NBC_01476]|uniref:S1C family serine protease n=1 Tax=Streptomyces sp. NBC_01476 TaxID=2903881 RepID=UPI002E35EAC0|nr:trypsin-like peptidase domain-containing protein [Streptomyces sp. NBC_01476]
MTESNRYSGEPQDPHDPQPPLYFGPQTPPATEGDTSATGFPPPPPYAPAEPPTHKRRRAGRPIALFAAVAVAAGVIGGGAGALIGNQSDSHSSTTAAATGAVNAALNGTVAGVAKAVSPSIVEIDATSNSGEAIGSGVIITADGQIVTNNHVVAGSDTIKVTYSNGKSATASVVGTDPQKDLALIKVNGASGLPAATLGDSSGLVIGDQVVAIGSPEGLAGTVTSGIVSALNRDVTVPVEDGQSQSQQGNGNQWPFSFGGNQYNGSTGSSTTTYKAIQTDASLNPGNSGGALINMSGQIVGINAAMYSADSSSGSGSSSAGSVGLGFAIPINTVKSDLANLRAGGSGDTSNGSGGSSGNSDSGNGQNSSGDSSGFGSGF